MQEVWANRVAGQMVMQELWLKRVGGVKAFVVQDGWHEKSRTKTTACEV